MTRSDKPNQPLCEQSVVPARRGITDQAESSDRSPGPFPLAAVERLQFCIVKYERLMKLAKKKLDEAQKRDNRRLVEINRLRVGERKIALSWMRWIGRELFDNRDIDRISDECDS